MNKPVWPHITTPALLSSFSLVFLLFSANLQAEEVYKWIDESGGIHYSDIKPSHVDSQSLKIRAGSSNNSRLSAQEQANEMKAQQNQELEARAQKLQEETKKSQNDARCQVLRDNLKKFAENSRIKIKENGELRYLTPEEMNRKKEEYQRTLKEEC